MVLYVYFWNVMVCYRCFHKFYDCVRLCSMKMVVWRWSGSLGKYQSWKKYLLQYAKVPYVTASRENFPTLILTLSLNQLDNISMQQIIWGDVTGNHFKQGELRLYLYLLLMHATLSFPPWGVTETSCYCFEYNLHVVENSVCIICEALEDIVFTVVYSWDRLLL